MKKSFLLLLWATLLPLALWAQTITISPNHTFTKTYGEADPTLTNQSWVTMTVSGGTNQQRNAFNGSDNAKAQLFARLSIAQDFTTADAGNHTYTLVHSGNDEFTYNFGGGVGTVTFTIAHSGTGTFAISRANNAITSVSLDNWAYGETAKTPSVTATNTDGAITYEYYNGGWSSTVPTAVGDYQVRATIAQSTNYYAVTSDPVAFKITKANVTVTIGNVTRSWRNPWVDPTMDEIAPTVTGGTTNWNEVKSFLIWNQLEAVGDAGKQYSYTLAPNGTSDNYNILVSGTGTLNVEKNTTGALATVSNGNAGTYTGNPLALIPGEITFKDAQGNDAGTFEYSLDGTTWSAEYPTATEAGTYTVYYRGIGDQNHEDQLTAATYQSTIAKRAIDLTTDIAKAPAAVPNLVYEDGMALTPIHTLLEWTGNISRGTVNYYRTPNDDGWTLGPRTWDHAGTWTIQVRIQPDANHTLNGQEYPNWVELSALSFETSIAKAKNEFTTVPVAATGLTYDATPKNLLSAIGVAKGGAEVQYKVDFEAFDGTKVAGTYAAGMPQGTNAGTYTIYYQALEAADYNAIAEQELVGKVVIAKAEWPAANIVDPVLATWTYDGDAHALITTPASATGFGTDVAADGDFVYYLDDVETAIANIKATNANEDPGYKVSYSIKETANYKAVDKKDLTVIFKKAPLDIAAQDIEVDWTGTAIDLPASHYAKGDPTDFVAKESEEEQYEIVNSLVELASIEGATTEKPIPTDAGYYKFTLKKAEPDPTPCNYKINNFSPNASLQINKIASTSATVAAADLTYNGDKQNLLDVTGTANGGTMKYYLAASKTETAPAKDSGKWVDAIPQGQDAGKYYVYSYVKGDNNHNDVEPAAASTEVVIKAKDLKDAFFTLGPVAPNNLVYTGADQKASVTITAKDTELDAALTDADYTVTKPAKMIDATEYTFTFTGKGNYTGNATAKIAIAQKALAEGDFVLTPNTGVYDGKDYVARVTVTTELKAADYEAIIPSTMINVDEYTYTFNGKGNYTGSQSVKFTITKADPTIEPTEEKTVVYNGADQELAKAATSKDGTFTYAAVAAGAEAPADAAYTKDIPVALNAGQYDVYTKFTPDANHNAATVDKVTATIEKKNIGIMLNTLDESIEANIITYNGEAVPMNAKLWTIYAPSDLPGVDANLPVNDRPFSFKFPAEVKNAGDYVFTELTPVWKDEKVQNYTFTFSQAAKFTVHPKKLDKAMITLDPTSAPYKKGVKHTVAVTVADGNPSILVFGDKAAAKNDVNYVIKNGDATVANGSIEAAGTYNFVFTAQNNYEGEVIVPFTVNNKDIAALLQDADWSDKVYNGKNQAPTVVLKDKKINDKGKEEEFTLTEGTDYELKVWMPTGETTAQAVAKDQVINVAYNQQAYRFEISGKGNYSGLVKKYKKITPKPLEDKDFTMAASAEYIALGQMPAITAKSSVGNLVECTFKDGVNKVDKDYQVYVDDQLVDTKTYKLNEAKDYTFKFKGVNNYTGTITKNFTITKATVIVTASSYTKKYNGKNGVEGAKVVGGGDAWTYSGLKNYDGFDPALVQAAEGALTVKPVNNQTKDVGTYQLVVDPSKFTYGVEPGVNNYNFIVADEQGTLTIEKTPIVLGFDTEKKDNSGNTVPVFITKEYGVKDADFFSKNNQFVEKFVKVKAAEDDSPIAAELAGLAYEIKDGKGKVIRPAGLTFSRDNADVEAVGKYTGVVTMTADGGVFSNYDVAIHSTKGNFEIAKAVLTIALKDDIEVIYDGAVPTEEVASISNDKLAVSGKQWNDDYSVIKNVKGTIVNPSEHVGSYVVKLEAEAENYTVVTLDARIIIREAPLTVTIADQTINKTPVKDVNTMLKTSKAATVKGIVGNDDIKATMVVANGVDTQAPGAKDPGVKFTIANTDYKLVDAKGNKLDAVYGKLIVLADGYEIALNDAAAYNQAKKETHDVTFTTRSVNQDTWNVCVLPFETTPAEVSDMFGYAVVDLLNKDANDGNIHFVVTTSGVIPAGTPFVFKPTKDAAGAVTDFDQVVFKDVEVLPLKDFATKELFVEGGNTYAKDAANNKFWGTFKETSFEGKKFWYMSKGDWKDASQRSVTLKSYRAYVEFDEANVAAGARIFVEEADGTITAIKGIDANGQLIAADGWYTVNGMKLDAAPTQKGTYIKDGKKVFVK